MKLSHFFAAVALAAGASVASAQAVTYNIDPTHTYPRFSWTHFGLSTQQAKFNSTKGTVVFDKKAKTGTVDLTIDVKSMNTGYEKFNEHMLSEDFFDVAKFPTATFKSTKVDFQGDRPVAVQGNLTIKGVTKPVTLQVTRFANMQHPMLKKDAIGADASVTVKRTDFNLGKYAPAVSDEITITVALEAVAAQ